MISNNLFTKGMFLGYSILHLLEYGVSGIFAAMTHFKIFPHKTPNPNSMKYSSRHKKWIRYEAKMDDCQVIEDDKKTVGRSCIDCKEKFKAIDEKLKEIDTRILFGCIST